MHRAHCLKALATSGGVPSCLQIQGSEFYSRTHLSSTPRLRRGYHLSRYYYSDFYFLFWHVSSGCPVRDGGIRRGFSLIWGVVRNGGSPTYRSPESHSGWRTLLGPAGSTGPWGGLATSVELEAVWGWNGLATADKAEPSRMVENLCWSSQRARLQFSLSSLCRL